MVLVVVVAVVVSIYLSVYLQARKRSYSARLPQFLTTSKTTHFCETSSAFEVDNVKNETILRDFLQKWKVECRADGLVPMRFAFFHSICLKCCACHEKSDARPYEVLHLSRKIIFPKLKIWCSKMQPLSGNQRPDLLTALMNMSLVLRLPWKMHLCRSSSDVLYMTSPVPLRYPARGGLHTLAMWLSNIAIAKKIKLGSNIRPEKKRQAQKKNNLGGGHSGWRSATGRNTCLLKTTLWQEPLSASTCTSMES